MPLMRLLPDWHPQIDVSRHVRSVVRATLLAPRLVDDAAERLELVDAYLREYARVESALLACDGHESAGLMAQIGSGGGAPNLLDGSALRRREEAVGRNVRFAAHTVAFLLIAQDTSPEKANHKHACESWNRLQATRSNESESVKVSLTKRWTRTIWADFGPTGPLALAEIGVAVARLDENRNNTSFLRQAHLDVLALTDDLAQRLYRIRLDNGKALIPEGFFWTPPVEWVELGGRSVRIEQVTKFSSGLFANVLDGLVDPVEALCRMGVRLR